MSRCYSAINLYKFFLTPEHEINKIKQQRNKTKKMRDVVRRKQLCNLQLCFLLNCTARQCSPLGRKFMECYIIKPAQSLLMKHLVIGQR